MALRNLSTATATASSFFNNDAQYSPPKAIDGSNTTFYSSQTSNITEFWQLDLGTNVSVGFVNIVAVTNNFVRSRNIRVTGSLTADFASPITIGDTPSTTTGAQITKVTPASPVTVRYIRLQKTSSTSAVDDTLTIAEFQVDEPDPAATTYTLAAPTTTSGNVGIASGFFTVALPNATSLASPVTITPSDSGNSGTFSPTTVQLSNATRSATFTYTPASTGLKTISCTNSGTLTNPASVSYTGNAATGSMTSVSISVSYSGSNVQLVAIPSGGTAPFNYQWHRYTVSGTILSGTTAVTGAVSSSFTDTTVRNSIVYYKCVVSDASPSTLTSIQAVAQVTPATLRIGFIGDSITAQGGSLADYITALSPLFSGGVIVTNRGVSGSETSGWLPASTNYTGAKSAFTSANVEYVSIMLGTNDANVSSRTAADYRTNLSAIVTDLVTSGFRVILNTSPYEIPANAGGTVTTVTEAKLDLLQQYRQQIPQLVDNVNVFLGDITAFNYFARNQEELKNNGSFASAGSLGDGLHPSAIGNGSLQKLWAAALQRAILRQQLPTTSGAVVRTGTTTLPQSSTRGGVNLGATNFALTGSVFDVTGTVVYYYDTTGVKSWKKGQASFLNTLPGTNKDEIPAYASFQVFAGQAITVQNSQFSFGSTI